MVYSTHYLRPSNYYGRHELDNSYPIIPARRVTTHVALELIALPIKGYVDISGYPAAVKNQLYSGELIMFGAEVRLFYLRPDNCPPEITVKSDYYDLQAQDWKLIGDTWMYCIFLGRASCESFVATDVWSFKHSLTFPRILHEAAEEGRAKFRELEKVRRRLLHVTSGFIDGRPLVFGCLGAQGDTFIHYYTRRLDNARFYTEWGSHLTLTGYQTWITPYEGDDYELGYAWLLL